MKRRPEARNTHPAAIQDSLRRDVLSLPTSLPNLAAHGLQTVSFSRSPATRNAALASSRLSATRRSGRAPCAAPSAADKIQYIKRKQMPVYANGLLWIPRLFSNGPETTCLADEIFKHGRLDRQQIVAVLAPPLGGVVPRANAALWLADRPPRAGFSHLRLLTRFPPFFRWQKCDISVAFCSIFR